MFDHTGAEPPAVAGNGSGRRQGETSGHAKSQHCEGLRQAGIARLSADQDNFAAGNRRDAAQCATRLSPRKRYPYRLSLSLHGTAMTTFDDGEGIKSYFCEINDIN